MISTNKPFNDTFLYRISPQGHYITISLNMSIMLLKILLKYGFREQTTI
jgi:hypothetical protein